MVLAFLISLLLVYQVNNLMYHKLRMVFAIVKQPKLPMKLVSRFITKETKSSGYLTFLIFYISRPQRIMQHHLGWIKRIAIKKSLRITTSSLPVKFICIQE